MKRKKKKEENSYWSSFLGEEEEMSTKVTKGCNFIPSLFLFHSSFLSLSLVSQRLSLRVFWFSRSCVSQYQLLLSYNQKVITPSNSVKEKEERSKRKKEEEIEEIERRKKKEITSTIVITILVMNILLLERQVSISLPLQFPSFSLLFISLFSFFLSFFFLLPLPTCEKKEGKVTCLCERGQ